MLSRVLVIAVLGAVIVSGCGRRGSLQAPGTTEAPPAIGSNLLLDPASPGAQEPAGTAPGGAPDRPFLLDFLI